MTPTIEPTEIVDFETYKFVRVKPDIVRFSSFYQDHSSLVSDGEQAIGAGLFATLPNQIEILDSYSMTLKIIASDEDWELVGKILGRSVVRR